MQYAQLGRSGLKISRLVLGSTMFGELMDEDAARAVVHRAWDAGITTIDTGDIYASGRSEEMIGRLISHRREQLVICTKVGFRIGDSPADHAAALQGQMEHGARWARGISPNDQGLSRKHILAAVDASLRRLGTDYIDLYQIHRWDPSVPIDETLRALDDLVRAGKVRYVGCSNARSWQLYEALWASDRRDRIRFESMQVPYSMLDRSPESDVLPACAHAGVGVIAYSTLAGGVLTGLHRKGVVPGTVLAQREGYQKRFLIDEHSQRLDQLEAMALRMDRSMIELALAGVLQHRAVSGATIGVQRPEEIDALARAVDHPLNAQSLDELYRIFS